jgi:Uma2 family endonuclease
MEEIEMSVEAVLSETRPLVLCLGPLRHKMTEEDFFQLCGANPELRIERTSEGDLIVMSPAGGRTSNRNMKLSARVANWAEADGTGVAFDSSGGFVLPNGAERAADAAWVKRSRWDQLTEQQQESFPPLCPDFVVELLSPSDTLKEVQAKMEEYVANGAQLGWLIDPFEKRVHVYRPGQSAVCLDHPESVSGEPLLRGFTLYLKQIWD